jgi:hypothetical protein
VINSGEALDELLSELERKIDRLRTLYENYFMGIEKVEPQVARKEVLRMVLHLAQQHIRNTGQRFRFHSLQQRWNIYITYWNRTMREIEAGTYKRDVARVTRKAAREGQAIPDEVAFELKVKRRAEPGADAAPVETSAAPAQPSPPVAPSVRATPGPRVTPAPRVAPPPGMTAEQMDSLYRRYVQAKKTVGDAGAEGVQYNALVATVAKQTPAILQKYACSAVDFTVVIKDQKVVLKAVPKK